MNNIVKHLCRVGFRVVEREVGVGVGGGGRRGGAGGGGLEVELVAPAQQQTTNSQPSPIPSEACIIVVYPPPDDHITLPFTNVPIHCLSTCRTSPACLSCYTVHFTTARHDRRVFVGGQARAFGIAPRNRSVSKATPPPFAWSGLPPATHTLSDIAHTHHGHQESASGSRAQCHQLSNA